MSKALREFTTGQQPQLVITAPGRRFDLAHVLGFEVQQQMRELTITRIDGTSLRADIPTGWAGTICLERPEPTLRELTDGEDVPTSMYQYVMDSDGSVSTYQYEGMTVKFSDDLRMEFMAAYRRRV